MVFIWVNTGVLEPYIPQTSTQIKVPKTYGNQRSSELVDQQQNSTNQPNPGIHPLPQDVYKANEKTLEPGDKVSFIYEIMSSPVFTLSMDETLSSVKATFAKKKFRHIPIVNSEDTLLGIISERDILRALAEDISSDTNIKELMNMRVLTTISDATIRESAKVMINERIGCLPVLSSNQKLIGIITRSDILRLIINRPRINIFA
ncbi:MAG: CBS domain-containing protein [Leptospiraceae bacterium]|nr:CBS domain-containing protein [Leptospiraceae bacterium]